MTDNDIIKAMEYCFVNENHCRICPYMQKDHCIVVRTKDALDLINRQKAKIERLEYEIMKTKLEKHLLNETVEEIKAEAIKEFAERLKANFDTYTDDEEANALYMRRLIDNLVKEMVGDNE